MEENSTTPNYWIARMTNNDNPCREKATKKRFFSTQYSYDSEDALPGRTIRFLNAVLEVRAGDILLLTIGNRIYAFGYVKKYTHKFKQISSIAEVINNQKHNYSEGIVGFSDSDVFYENFERGIKGWEQRINVDKWHCYSESLRVSANELQLNLREGYYTQDTLCGVSKKFGEDKIRDLKRSKKLKKKCMEDSKDKGTYVLKRVSIISCAVVFVALPLLCFPFRGLFLCSKEESVALAMVQTRLFETIKEKMCDNVASGCVIQERQMPEMVGDTLYITYFAELVYNSFTNDVNAKYKWLWLKENVEQVDDTIKAEINEFTEKSVSVYSTSIVQIDKQYEIYEVIYYVSYESDNIYVLCKILINKDEKYGDEICPVMVSGRLKDLLRMRAVTKMMTVIL